MTGGDSIVGGTGNDTVFMVAGFGQDTVVGGAGEDVVAVAGFTLAQVNSVDNGNGTFTIDFGGADTILVEDVEWIKVDDGSVRIV